MDANHWNIGKGNVKSRKKLSSFKLTSSSFRFQVLGFKVQAPLSQGEGLGVRLFDPKTESKSRNRHS